MTLPWRRRRPSSVLSLLTSAFSRPLSFSTPVFPLHFFPSSNGGLLPSFPCRSWSCRSLSASAVSDPMKDDVQFLRTVRDKCRTGCLENLEDAMSAFGRMLQIRPLPSVIEFTQLVAAVVRMKRYPDAISLLERMSEAGVEVNIYTLSILINCLCQSKRVDLGLSVLGRIIKLGFTPGPVTLTSLANGLCIEGKISGAVRVVDDMVDMGIEPNAVTYGVIIKGLARTGKSELALELLERWEVNSSRTVDTITYNTILDGLFKEARVDRACDLFNKMNFKGINPNVITYSSVIRGLSSSGR